jgi:UTP:GlnB (protein PII) uridylyltransferase
MRRAGGYLKFLRDCSKAMPQSYHVRYDAFAVADHARIIFDRGDQLVHAGAFRGDREHGTPVCIAGGDRQAVFSALSRAVVLARFDVAAAEAYTVELEDEAPHVMALVWVRRANGQPLDEAELTLLLDVLVAVANRDDKVRRTVPTSKRRPTVRAAKSAQVRFLEGLDGNLSVLEVETSDRSGFLSALVDVLLAQQLEIIHCEVQASGGRVRDRFRLVESNGASVAPWRWREIQVHVLDAIAQSVGVPEGSRIGMATA